MIKLLFLLGSILAFNFTYCQNGRFLYQFEVGALVSVGKNTYKTEIVDINNITSLSYAVNKRFEHPSLRLRGAFLYNFIPRISAGIESGVNLRFGESFYNNQVLYSIPAQLKVITRLKKFNNKVSLDLDATAGYNFINLTKYPVEENGGFIFSSGFLLKKAQQNITLYAKIGFERQTENLRATFAPREPSQKTEYYDFKRFRNQILVTFGINLY